MLVGPSVETAGPDEKRGVGVVFSDKNTDAKEASTQNYFMEFK